MSETETRLRGSTRWSSTSRCVRMAWYAHQGVEPEPFDDVTKRRLRRGKLDEQVILEEYRERYGAEDVISQKAVPWPSEGMPLGELHTDIFVTSERLPVEVKSHANGEPTASDWIQLAGQVRFDEDAGDAGILTIVTRDLNTNSFPLILTDELRDEVDGRVSELAEALETGQPPARVCQKPGDARGMFCSFAETCFAGWHPPNAEEFSEPALAARALIAKRAFDAAKGESEEAEREWKDARQALLDAGLPEGNSVCGPVSIRRTRVLDSERFSLSKARSAGAWLEGDSERFSPFVTYGGGHDRISIEKTGDAPLEPDFGDEAPF